MELNKIYNEDCLVGMKKNSGRKRGLCYLRFAVWRSQ